MLKVSGGLQGPQGPAGLGPSHLVVVELRLAGHHLSLLGVFALLAADATEHVELLTHAARHRPKPEQNQREARSSENLQTQTGSGSGPEGELGLCDFQQH